MMAPVPANEAERLAKLREYGVLDTDSEKAFDDITWLAAHICDAPVALVSLIDADRQWFKSCIGLSAREMPREVAFCAHAILTPELTLVPDTMLDPRFCDNPLVTSEPRVRFYAGAPLMTPDGHALGTLCVVDFAPRTLTDDQAEALQNLSRLVVAQLELRRAAAEQRESKRDLQAATDSLRLLLESSGEGLYGVDAEGRCTFMNPAAARMFGCAPEDMLGRVMHPLMHHSHANGDAYPLEDCPVHWTLRTGRECRIDYEVLWRMDGTSFPAHYSAAPLVENGAVCGCVITCVDISDRKALETERERLLEETERLLADAVKRADRDPLTGLLNHGAFHKRLQEEADRVQREGQPLAVAMVDLDNFKFFNDVYGYQSGDEVLRRVAEGLREFCRSYDVIARFGGDEFAVLMPGLKGEDAEAMTWRLVQAMAALNFTPPGHDTPIPLGISAGVAVFPDDAPGRLEVVEVADARLRLAKTGADEVVVVAQRARRAAASKFEGFPMLDALVAAVDNKDRYTRRHSEEVLAYSLEIAREMEWTDSERHILGVAALLHDVGKIGVPDHILRKPGRLTDEEYQAMKQHSMMGAVMVGAVPGFEAALDAIRHHHERWDGGGYPFGLREREIPAMARLLAVADSFSAMTTDRPYRKGMTRERALAILRDGAGTQWDPCFVAAFLRAKARQWDAPDPAEMGR